MNKFFLAKGASEDARITLFQWIREQRKFGGTEGVILLWDQQNQKIQAAYDSSSHPNIEIANDGSVLERNFLNNQLEAPKEIPNNLRKKIPWMKLDAWGYTNTTKTKNNFVEYLKSNLEKITNISKKVHSQYGLTQSEYRFSLDNLTYTLLLGKTNEYKRLYNYSLTIEDSKKQQVVYTTSMPIDVKTPRASMTFSSAYNAKEDNSVYSQRDSAEEDFGNESILYDIGFLVDKLEQLQTK